MATGNKFIPSWIVVALLLAVSYYAVSPYISIAMMRSAGHDGDYATVNEYVDYPALRENFKGQFKARLVKGMTKDRDNAMATGLALAFAPVLIDNMVDAYITPEGVAMMLEGADAEEEQEAKKVKGEKVDAKIDTEPTITQGYAGGLDRFVMRVEREDVMVTMVFRRSGLTTWKLTEVDLPDEAFE